MALRERAMVEEMSPDEVVAWRCGELERAGYELPAACELATSRQVDLHLAVELLQHGCPEETALRILL